VFAAFRQRAHARSAPFELREEMAGVIAWLHGRRLRLGLAANKPHATLEVLDRHGVGQYFHHREVSGTHGYRKPDPRLFVRCCEDLGVSPEACVMVGDRIDNDIAPAKLLGMRAVLFRTGRHVAQQPRSHQEAPDAEVRDAAELRAALERLLT
jgi:HAD superfamily hydrolase (TIGR01509 family)